MKTRVKAIDLRLPVSFCLLFTWLTLCFIPAQSSNFAKNSFSGAMSGTVIDSRETSHGDTFEPFALFKESLSKLSLQKSSPTAKFLPVLRTFLPISPGCASLGVLAAAPALDFFHFTPPNKASP